MAVLFLAYCHAGFPEKVGEILKIHNEKITSDDLIQIGHKLRKGKFYHEAIEVLNYANQEDPRTQLCRAFIEMSLGRFEDALQSLAGKPYPDDIDIRLIIRQSCGIIFLADHLLNFSKKIAPEIEKAVQFVNNIDRTKVGDRQEQDFRKAMNIAQENFHTLFFLK